MKFIIDRFEGEYAVCEVVGENELTHIRKSDLPLEAKEGYVIFYNSSGELEVDKDMTDKRELRIKSKMDELWK